MRVLVERHKDRLIEYSMTCYNCGSELAVTKKDITTGQYNEPMIKCPVCHYYNDWNPRKLKPLETNEIDEENTQKMG